MALLFAAGVLTVGRIGITWDEPKWFPPWELDEAHELVEGALRGLRHAGLDPGQASYQFCTNGAQCSRFSGESR